MKYIASWKLNWQLERGKKEIFAFNCIIFGGKYLQYLAMNIPYELCPPIFSLAMFRQDK